MGLQINLMIILSISPLKHFLGYDFGLNLSLCPEEGDENWVSFDLVDLPKMRNHFDIGIPMLPVDTYDLLLWWTLSPYR